MEQILKNYQNILLKKYPKLEDLKIVSKRVNSKAYKDGHEIICYYKNEYNNKTELFSFSISMFPDCCGIAIIGALERKFYGPVEKIGEYLVDLIVALCKNREYGYIILTDKEQGKGNKLIERLKENYKFQKIDNFLNPGTNNKVDIWLLNLNM